MIRFGYARAVGIAVVVALSACAPEPTQPALSLDDTSESAQSRTASKTGAVARGKLRALNARLAKAGARYAVVKAELALSPNGSADRAQEVFAFDHMHRLPSQWVPGDPLRGADGNNITYMNDGSFMTANGAGNAESAIDASFRTWGQVSCGKVKLVKRADDGKRHSAVLGDAEEDLFASDIYTLGFVPGTLFDEYLGEGASDGVLGVTFTFVFGDFDADGEFTPSDVDKNGREDTAIAEVWYNDKFKWTTSNATDVDVETVALHENGHALSLGHFGKVSINSSTGRIQLSPRAVMNAFIFDRLTSPLGTDRSSYCSNWSAWPN